MPTYLMYLRKSRADQEAEARGEGETLARHEKLLRALAEKNGHLISAVYREIVSGEMISMRPQMQALLSRIVAGGVDGVYVTEVERLARGNTSDQGQVAETFKYGNTKIITLSKTYDPNNEFDEEYFEFGLFMSRREYKTINRRIQTGRIQSVKEGKYICSRPAYGYRKVKLSTDKGYTLEPYEPEASVVRDIFSWYVYGYNGHTVGYTAIGTLLDKMCVPPGAQGLNWRPSRIQRILTNPVYIGMIQFGKNSVQKVMTEDGLRKKRSVNKNAAYFVRGLHVPIIEKALFDKAQLVARQRGRAIPMRHDMAMSNPLAGLLTCSECGHIMTRLPPSGRQPAIYKCLTRGCPTVQTYADAVEAVVFSQLSAWLDAMKLGQNPFEGLSDATASAALKATCVNLKTQIADCEQRIQRLYALVESGAYSPALFAARHAALQSELKTLQASLDAAAKELRAIPSYAPPEALIWPIQNVIAVYKTLPDAASKNALLRTVISRVEYAKTIKGSVKQGISPTQFTVTVYPVMVD